MTKIRVLNVVDEFHPDAGYENNILSKFMVQLGYDYQILTTSFVAGKNYMDFLGSENIAQKDAEFTERTGVKITRLPIKRRVSGRAIWRFRAFMESVDSIRPDILFFCGNDTLIFISFVRKFKKQLLRGTLPYKIIADSHMLEMAARNKLRFLFYRFYRSFVTPIIIKAGIKVIRMQDDDFVRRRLGVPASLSPFISFGTDTSLFFPSLEQKKAMRSQLGIPDDAFVVLYAGKISEEKGGLILSGSLLEKMKTKSGKELAFLVLANATGEYEKRVVEELAKSENRVLLHPTVPYAQLAPFFQAADLAIFPKQCSLSFFDLQACGVPVVLENNSINEERVSHGNGFLYDGTCADLRRAILAAADDPHFNLCAQHAVQFIRENYDYQTIAKQFDWEFSKLLEGRQQS